MMPLQSCAKRLPVCIEIVKQVACIVLCFRDISQRQSSRITTHLGAELPHIFLIHFEGVGGGVLCGYRFGLFAKVSQC